MKKLQYSQGKTLKLINVLVQKVTLENPEIPMNFIIEKMQSYIRVKGAGQIGPLIQYMTMSINADNKPEIEMKIMVQCNSFISAVEEPYQMEKVICVPNCLYCRYTGPEESLKFAYDKINLEAFENDISISSENYTIFVDRNIDEAEIVADVFVPIVDRQ